MKKEGINTYFIKITKIMGSSTYSAIMNNKPITTETLDKLCYLFECRVEDLIEYIPDPEKGKQELTILHKQEE